MSESNTDKICRVKLVFKWGYCETFWMQNPYFRRNAYTYTKLDGERYTLRINLDDISLVVIEEELTVEEYKRRRGK